MRRYRAEGCGGDGTIRWQGAGRFGRHGHAAALGELGLARDDPLKQLV